MIIFNYYIVNKSNQKLSKYVKKPVADNLLTHCLPPAIHTGISRFVAMASRTAAVAFAAAAAVIMPRAEVIIHMPQGEEQGDSQNYAYNISCHKDSS